MILHAFYIFIQVSAFSLDWFEFILGFLRDFLETFVVFVLMLNQPNYVDCSPNSLSLCIITPWIKTCKQNGPVSIIQTSKQTERFQLEKKKKQKNMWPYRWNHFDLHIFFCLMSWRTTHYPCGNLDQFHLSYYINWMQSVKQAWLQTDYPVVLVTCKYFLFWFWFWYWFSLFLFFIMIQQTHMIHCAISSKLWCNYMQSDFCVLD